MLGGAVPTASLSSLRGLPRGVLVGFAATSPQQTDHESARAFAAIEGSRLMHLSHNKHELTWLHV